MIASYSFNIAHDLDLCTPLSSFLNSNLHLPKFLHNDGAISETTLKKWGGFAGILQKKNTTASRLFFSFAEKMQVRVEKSPIVF